MAGNNEPRKPHVGIGLGWPVRLCLFATVVAMIYLLGTSLFSAARMKPLFYPWFRSLFGAGSEGQLLYYLSVVRWTAHYFQYFVLFLLLVWVLGLRPLSALILCLALGAADEGHQYFLPDRSCSLMDLKLDAAGAATAFILIAGSRRLRATSALQTDPVSEQTGPASA